MEDGSDLEARAGLALAAFYGGVCLGPVNTTAGHALAYPLGTRHKLAHGIANALIFPHVLAANARPCRRRPRWSATRSASAREGRQAGARRRARLLRRTRPRHGAGAATAFRATTCRPRRRRRTRSGGCSTGIRSTCREADILEIYEARLLRHRRTWRTRHDQGSFRRPRHLLQRRRDVNYAATRAQVRRQVAAGNNIMCAGTNGDFTALTFDEKVRLTAARWSTRSAAGPASSSTPACRRPSRRCCWRASSQDIGVDGIAVITPFFIAGARRTG